MNSVRSSAQSLREMFVGKTQEFIDEIDNVHLVWLQEIQQEANRMFSRYLELKGNLVVFLNHLLLSLVQSFTHKHIFLFRQRL